MRFGLVPGSMAVRCIPSMHGRSYDRHAVIGLTDVIAP